MNHPKPEEWVAYLYGDAPSNQRQELSAHLRACAQCRDEVETWKRGLHRLDNWKLSAVRRRRPMFTPLLKWAAAAALVLACGIVIGRATAPRVDLERVRQAVVPAIRRDLERDLAEVVRQEVARSASMTLAAGHQYSDRVAAAYAQQSYLLSKKDLDTLAVNAAESLQNTAQTIYQLANYNVPQQPVNPNE